MSSFTYFPLQSAPGTARKQHPHLTDEMASYRGTVRNTFTCMCWYVMNADLVDRVGY